MTLENELKNTYGVLEGIYTIGGIVNDMDYFRHIEDRNYALWFGNYMVYGVWFWMLGLKLNLGTNSGYMIHQVADKKCPEGGEYPWLWNHFDGTDWIATTDISINCLDANAS